VLWLEHGREKAVGRLDELDQQKEIENPVGKIQDEVNPTCEKFLDTGPPGME
jgi:hypothetical protein